MEGIEKRGWCIKQVDKRRRTVTQRRERETRSIKNGKVKEQQPGER